MRVSETSQKPWPVINFGANPVRFVFRRRRRERRGGRAGGRGVAAQAEGGVSAAPGSASTIFASSLLRGLRANASSDNI